MLRTAASLSVFRLVVALVMAVTVAPLKRLGAEPIVSDKVRRVLLGGAAILGVGQPAVGFHNLYGLPGGFLPHGLKGVWMGVIMAIFSFVGAEMIAVTSGGGPTSGRSSIPSPKSSEGVLRGGELVACARGSRRGSRFRRSRPGERSPPSRLSRPSRRGLWDPASSLDWDESASDCGSCGGR